MPQMPGNIIAGPEVFIALCVRRFIVRNSYKYSAIFFQKIFKMINRFTQVRNMFNHMPGRNYIESLLGKLTYLGMNFLTCNLFCFFAGIFSWLNSFYFPTGGFESLK